MAVRLACARCGVTLAVAEYEDVAHTVAEQLEKGAEFAGDPADPDRAWCPGCVRERRWRDTAEFAAITEQWGDTGPSIQGVRDAGADAMADLRRRISATVTRQLRDTEPTRLSESERHAAIAKAMRTVDVEWLAEMVLIDHDIGPLPPSPEEPA